MAFLQGGCAAAPSLNILGAFFPGWLFCMAGGLLATLAARSFLLKKDLIGRLGPLILAYPALMAFFSMLLWIIFFA